MCDIELGSESPNLNTISQVWVDKTKLQMHIRSSKHKRNLLLLEQKTPCPPSTNSAHGSLCTFGVLLSPWAHCGDSPHAHQNEHLSQLWGVGTQCSGANDTQLWPNYYTPSPLADWRFASAHGREKLGRYQNFWAPSTGPASSPHTLLRILIQCEHERAAESCFLRSILHRPSRC